MIQSSLITDSKPTESLGVLPPPLGRKVGKGGEINRRLCEGIMFQLPNVLLHGTISADLGSDTGTRVLFWEVVLHSALVLQLQPEGLTLCRGCWRNRNNK